MKLINNKYNPLISIKKLIILNNKFCFNYTFTTLYSSISKISLLLIKLFIALYLLNIKKINNF